MTRPLAMIVRAVMPVAVLACGCGDTPKPAAPRPVAPVQTPKETEADREQQRHAAAMAIVPAGTTCLPAALKQKGAPRLDLATIGQELVVCAVDSNDQKADRRVRLLGPIACWKVDLGTSGLTYQEGEALPGRGIAVTTDAGCARGFCLPKGTQITDDVAYIVWNDAASKVAVLAGDDVHIFDTTTRNHESKFSIRGARGVTNKPTGVHWVGAAIVVEGADPGPSSGVWMFKVDGTPIGPFEAIGSKEGKPISTHGGSLSILDNNRIAVAEQGFSSLTIYEIDSTKRSKLVRKLSKPPCKNDELDAYWHDHLADVSPACRDHMAKNFEHLIGATAVATTKSFLVMLRGTRLGEIGILDQKTLAEKKVIKLPWCAGAAGAAPSAGSRTEADAGGASTPVQPNHASPRSPVPRAANPSMVPKAPAPASPKDSKSVKGAEDPDSGGE